MEDICGRESLMWWKSDSGQTGFEFDPKTENACRESWQSLQVISLVYMEKQVSTDFCHSLYPCCSMAFIAYY